MRDWVLFGAVLLGLSCVGCEEEEDACEPWRYGNGECDDWCLKHDPDCDDVKGRCHDGICEGEDPCADGRYDDDHCDTECDQRDDACLGPDRKFDMCQMPIAYIDGHCDGGCYYDDADCRADCSEFSRNGVCDPGCMFDPECGDPCTQWDLYGNGICDILCLQTDPDCSHNGRDLCEEMGVYRHDDWCAAGCPDDPECQDSADCSENGHCNARCRDTDPDCTEDPCADGLYGDGTCHRDCWQHDPDCPDPCEEEGRYNDSTCDRDCLTPDPDCGCQQPTIGWGTPVINPNPVTYYTPDPVVLAVPIELPCGVVVQARALNVGGVYLFSELNDSGSPPDETAEDDVWSGTIGRDAADSELNPIPMGEHTVQLHIRVDDDPSDTGGDYPVAGPTTQFEVRQSPEATLSVTPMGVGPAMVLASRALDVRFDVLTTTTGGATVTEVTADLRSIGGDDAAAFTTERELIFPGDTRFWLTTTLPDVLTAASYSIPIVVSATGGLASSSELGFEAVDDLRVSFGAISAEPSTIPESTASVVTFRAEIETVACEPWNTRVQTDLLNAGHSTGLGDSGSEGDETAGDGVYTGVVEVPDTVVAGTYTLPVSTKCSFRYELNGQPQSVETTATSGVAVTVSNIPTIHVSGHLDGPWYNKVGETHDVVFRATAAGWWGATVTGVAIDLSQLGGDAQTAMHNDGQSPDETADDLEWAVAYTLPASVVKGVYTPTVVANGTSESGPLQGENTVEVRMVKGYRMSSFPSGVGTLSANKQEVFPEYYGMSYPAPFPLSFYGQTFPTDTPIEINKQGTVGIGANMIGAMTAQELEAYFHMHAGVNGPIFPGIAVYHNPFPANRVWVDIEGDEGNRTFSIVWRGAFEHGWPYPGSVEFMVRFFENPEHWGADFKIAYGTMRNTDIMSLDWSLLAALDISHFDVIHVPSMGRAVEDFAIVTISFTWEE